LIFILYGPQSFANVSLTQPLSTTLTHLTLKNFEESVDKIPHSVTRLVLSYDFNQPVDKLPPTLTQLGIISINLLNIFHQHSLTSQLGTISTNQLINFHQN
jgi:hypothetical protein